MNERVLILREAIVKIGQMLAGKGVKISQRGTQARVVANERGVPVEVILPYIPDNASEDLCYAIQGFLDHEVAHILFSDFSPALHDRANSENVHFLMNAIEDARIEKEMAKKYAGSGLNISTMGKFYLDKFITPKLKEATAAGDAKKVTNTLMVPLIRALSGQQMFKEFMADRMKAVQHVVDAIGDLADEIANVKSSEDSLNVALKLKERMKGEGGGNGDDKDGDGGTDAESSDGKSKANKAKKSKPESKSKTKKKEKGEGESKPEGEKDDKAEKGGSEGKPEGEPEGEGEPESGEGEGGGEGEGESGEGEGGGEGEPEGEAEGEGGTADEGAESTPSQDEMTLKDDTPPVWDELDKDGTNDFDKALSRTISEDATTAMKNAEYRVFTKEADVVEPLHVGKGYNSEMFKSLADAVDHMVGPLQKDLERAITAKSMRAWEPGKRSGRIHAANLMRLAVNDARVFRRRIETDTKDVAVELVIDISGSMGGQKAQLATESAYALSQVLERLNIKHEVICFTTGHMPPHLESEYNDSARKIGGYSRYEPLYMPVIKTFDERHTTNVKERFGWLPNINFMRNNVDGECVELAAQRLMRRREMGKAMIVLSDGYPAAHGARGDLNEHLETVVKNIGKAGIKVVGLGILSEAVTKFYPRNVVINNLEELPGRVIKELRHMLIQD